MKIISSNSLIKVIETVKQKFTTKDEFNEKVVNIDDSINKIEEDLLQLDVVFETVEG